MTDGYPEDYQPDDMVTLLLSVRQGDTNTAYKAMKIPKVEFEFALTDAYRWELITNPIVKGLRYDIAKPQVTAKGLKLKVDATEFNTATDIFNRYFGRRLNEVPTSEYQRDFVYGYTLKDNAGTCSSIKSSKASLDGMNARIEDDYNRIQAQRLELAKWNRDLTEGSR